MCTAFTFNNKSMYFGRNMDIDVGFGEKVVITPRDYVLTTKCADIVNKHYAMIGMANVTNNYPLYAEAVNEKGLCMAGLNFPDNAKYSDSVAQNKINLAPYELIPYVLAKCADTQQAVKLLTDIEIVAVPFCDGLPLSTLHWIVSDNNRSVTIERTSDGIKIYENKFGVLTNNPPFPFHCENIKQYFNLYAQNVDNQLSETFNLRPFAQGMGAIGLPGDYSSASRFVKTVFNKVNSVCGQSTEESVTQVFHILDAVAMVSGSVLTDNGHADITRYSCCIDTENLAYYYKTYGNSRLTKITLDQTRKAQSKLLIFPLRSTQDIFEE